MERWTEAEAALTELAREHGDFENLSEAELWRGRACAAGGRARPARQAFERVVKLGPADLAAHARVGLARLLEAERDYEGALSEALKIAILYADPEAVATALLLAGGCLERLDEPERAAEQYRELVDRFPKQDAAAEARARLSTLTGETPRRL
jgi:TolA-binding protein